MVATDTPAPPHEGQRRQRFHQLGRGKLATSPAAPPPRKDRMKSLSLSQHWEPGKLFLVPRKRLLLLIYLSSLFLDGSWKEAFFSQLVGCVLRGAETLAPGKPKPRPCLPSWLPASQNGKLGTLRDEQVPTMRPHVQRGKGNSSRPHASYWQAGGGTQVSQVTPYSTLPGGHALI